jgi:hypothetical protein
MSLLPESASFEELVQDYFLAVRGSGVSLSALDVDLLSEWSRQAVPFEVVARGIARSADKARWDARPGEPVLRSLRACKREVEAEIKRWKDRAVGAPAEASEQKPRARRQQRTWEEQQVEKLAEALRRLAGSMPDLAPRAEQLSQALRDKVPTRPEELEAQETRVCLGLLRALPWEERLRVWGLARSSAGDSHYLSPRARRLARRFRLVTTVRQYLRLGE